MNRHSVDPLQQLDQLRAKVAILQHENKKLRRRVQRKQPHLRLLDRAEAAARLMAQWHVAGLSTSRRDCLVGGLSERNWIAGRALLLAGRVHDGYRITTQDPATLEQAIAYARRRCEQDIQVLRLRMARRGR